MVLTILLSLMMMAGLFLLLLGGVGFVQNKKFFSSAPRQIYAVVPDTKPERFHGQHAAGWMIIVLALALMCGGVVLGAWDGVRRDFSFWQFAARFMAMLLLLKAFDIIFFDWVLLCNGGFNFFPHFYPEVKAVLGRYLFGYNKTTHIIHVILFVPGVLLLSWICTLF